MTANDFLLLSGSAKLYFVPNITDTPAQPGGRSEIERLRRGETLTAKRTAFEVKVG